MSVWSAAAPAEVSVRAGRVAALGVFGSILDRDQRSGLGKRRAGKNDKSHSQRRE